MALYVVTVNEAPRVGQRRPRVYHWAVEADSPELAVRAWRGSITGSLYAQGPADTVFAVLADGQPLRIKF